MRIIVLTVAALVVVSCSSGTTSSGGGGCLTNAECESTLALASPTPSGCAEATCDLTTGRCKFTARDQDGDGDGERALICTGTEAIATGTDCDDLTPAINTAAIERCESSNIDENCNGMINEGCACPGPRTSGSPLAGRRARQSPVASFVQNDLP